MKMVSKGEVFCPEEALAYFFCSVCVKIDKINGQHQRQVTTDTIASYNNSSSSYSTFDDQHGDRAGPDRRYSAINDSFSLEINKRSETLTTWKHRSFSRTTLPQTSRRCFGCQWWYRWWWWCCWRQRWRW